MIAPPTDRPKPSCAPRSGPFLIAYLALVIAGPCWAGPDTQATAQDSMAGMDMSKPEAPARPPKAKVKAAAATQQNATQDSMPGMDTSKPAPAALPATQEGKSNAAAAGQQSGKPDSMPGMDMSKPAPAEMPAGQEDKSKATNAGQKRSNENAGAPKKTAPVTMAPMQGGTAPTNARDPNRYADGYEPSTMPGMEKSDQIRLGSVLIDQVEYVHGGDNRNAVAWDAQAWYGADYNKAWLRTEGGYAKGQTDATSTAEGLWWHLFLPFWATQVGVRQDLGSGARTWGAIGIQGLVPYWFDLQATAYVSSEGRFAGRLKTSYDILLTNRLILTPEADANIYSKGDDARGIGSGLANLELGLRLRYEIQREFAPYIGVDWERAFGATAGLRRRAGESIKDVTLLAGFRIWF